MEREPVFADLPARAFPLRIEMVDTATGALVWEVTVAGPGALVVPSRDHINGGRPVGVRIITPDGGVTESFPGDEHL